MRTDRQAEVGCGGCGLYFENLAEGSEERRACDFYSLECCCEAPAGDDWGRSCRLWVDAEEIALLMGETEVEVVSEVREAGTWDEELGRLEELLAAGEAMVKLGPLTGFAIL